MGFDVNAVGHKSVEFTAIVDLVWLHDEAVIVSVPFGVVARIGIDADGVEARSVVVRCERVVVGCRGVGTSAHLKLVAYAISVGIAEAVSVAVVSVGSVSA